MRAFTDKKLIVKDGDGLNPCFNGYALRGIELGKIYVELQKVLILVLMDMHCEEMDTTLGNIIGCLNPCFNGYALRALGRLYRLRLC